MSPRATKSRFDDADLLELEPVLRRVVRRRAGDVDDVDDVVQETLARLLDVRWRLDRRALVSYAIVTARNLVTSAQRDRDRDRRLAPRLTDPTAPQPPEDAALRHEERVAMAAALAHLDDEDARLLLAHDVDQHPLDKLAVDRGVTPGALAARLSRLRARLRVEHVLAFRRLEPRSPRCRPVLLALSAGDRRRQRELSTEQHLLDCPVCATVAEPLVRRDRRLLLLLPLGLALAALRWVRSVVRQHPVATAAAGMAATAAAVAVLVLALSGDAAPPPRTAPSPAPAARPVRASGTVHAGQLQLLPSAPRDLRPLLGRQVEGIRVRVETVPANEGFWIGTREDRLFVLLTGPGESPQRVRAGNLVTFDGMLVANPPRFAERIGLSAAEGARELARQGGHIAVDRQALRIAAR